MNTIKFNNTTTFEILNYNRSVVFENNNISASAICAIVASDVSDFNALAGETITQIQIFHDGTLIYNLNNTSASIYSINEYLDIDKMNISFNLIFDNVE